MCALFSPENLRAGAVKGLKHLFQMGIHKILELKDIMRRLLNRWTKSSVSDSCDIWKGGRGGGRGGGGLWGEGSERFKRESF